MRVAIIHYWLVNQRGGEQVLQELCKVFPEADIYTHVLDRKSLPESLRLHRIRTTFIAKLPWARRLYQLYLPLMPLALEELDLSQYDLVISSESGPAKGVITGTHATHICYCHTPMRYLWALYPEYRRNLGPLVRLVAPWLFHRLRIWDYCAAARVDHFIANSSAVAARIEKYYRRTSQVISPPVDVEFFRARAKRGGDDGFFLCCGELVAYKRAEVAVEAFNRMKKPLVVIGGGEALSRIRKIAGPTVQVLGRVPREVLADHYARCRALVFPGEEDFGIVPVEVMAAGRPVIAYGRGGVLDSVVDGVTGVLYEQQDVDGLIAAVERFETIHATLSQNAIMDHAKQFSSAEFRRKIRAFVTQQLCATTMQRDAGWSAPRWSA